VPRRNAGLDLLVQLLTGIPHTGGRDDPTLGLDEITEDEATHTVSTTLVLPSGDRYRVSVEWLREQSP
jgi:hypothetical protein